jgi:DMSO reductase family type II enzyme chaperone
MNNDPATASDSPDRQVVDRDDRELAQLRCVAYGACSELVASPHDLDPRDGLREKLGIGEVLDQARELELVMSKLVERDIDELKRGYSSLFEVGSDGPPVSIREDINTGQRAGTREDLVRFYDFFGYSLAERFAWAPDHLSVELEFMHFLCYGESSADDDALPFQLAQADFATRHFAWLADWSRSVTELQPDSLYAEVAAAIAQFAASDLAWQQGTIISSRET